MRFHVGMSFRPKQLIKWIIPILIALGLLSFADLKLALASSQTQTQIDINTIDINNVSICDHELTDYINYFQASLGNNYNFIVTYNNGYYYFTFIPVVSGVFNLYSYSYMPKDYYDSQRPDLDNVSITFLKYGSSDLSLSQRDLILDSTFTLIADPSSCSNTNFLNSPIAQTSFENYMTAYASFRENGIQKPNMFNVINSTNLTGVYSGYGNAVLTNTSSQQDPSGEVFFEFDYSNYWENYLIYSNLSTIYSDDLSWYQYYNSTDYIIQPVYRNNELINNNDTIDYDYIFVPSFPTTYNNMGNFYLNVPTEYLYSLDFKLKFTNSNIAEYTNNTTTSLNFYGRVNHDNNYFTYEKLTCSNTRHYDLNTNNNSALFTLGTISCSDNLSNYDTIVIGLYFYDDPSIDNVVSNVNYSYAHGTSIRTDVVKDIWQPLYHAHPLTKTLISAKTLDDNKYFYIQANNNAINFYLYDLMYMQILDTSYPLWYNTSKGFMKSYLYGNGKALLTYQKASQNQNYTDYNFFFDSDSCFSSSIGDTQYYYYDGVIYSNTFTIDYSKLDEGNGLNDYDTDYYFSFISDYINSINSDMYQFSILVQNVYDSMPNLLQSIFFVLFILGNIFILLKLIRK